ncbi:nucleotidyl transferase AbiEii/AbiGii toxin family protein [Rhizobium sp. VS19-DR104.2]|uniref:nucleotidyl transferase AbiEii/AbiGii toxin family protein n=1 Tax=unclassified Rhizobium TaxID=2613769 RepID=UPI001C5AC9BA|nr:MULTISPECIES: nucleotidyl transferase AbiEii/AbiGii toxin family protein [unclassified Rhizobium]MBZ5763573.1 nucleotidyl transferase AbiEii/AbiGii toxin family protein [Rhizobium sp. VS19-DR96]MBZ5769500.1 nucleotidyl transferase AbiEii/AbiGii toxin family protein [Rhizobium sp. VS19-DR129.2]MBZ5777078.1 nucleotidyl transferase AbiEii/AbiGii toxin family protein [Rhizobium sp. VS19-DRK62.2]MBZ5788210.1 nucleotidyl transferase AbiEii/AbiGii toxin family protein [Rhizobium sp. VS19-DR121]MBZ
MADAFLSLSAADRREVLGVAADRSGRPAHLLEKDAWVVWALAALYGSPLGEHLVFKGGTSLSKAYGVIRRFSEDVDLTYDIRALAPELVGDNGEALPKTRSEEKRWSSEVRKRLPEWVAETAQPTIANALASEGLAAAIRVEDDKLFIDYEATATGSGYVAPSVMLEFGARSTGEPASPRDVVCDAAGLVEEVEFPTARPRVMHAERTFWEKATAIHVFCLQARLRGDRFARHWHDIARLDEAGLATAAFADRELAQAVARHKSMIFAEKAADREPIDYAVAVNGGLRLVPDGDALKALEDDYLRMVEDGLLLEEAEPFEALVARCTDIAARANRMGA